MLSDVLMWICILLISFTCVVGYYWYIIFIRPFIFYKKIYHLFVNILTNTDMKSLTFNQQGLEYIKSQYTNLPHDQQELLDGLTFSQFKNLGKMWSKFNNK